MDLSKSGLIKMFLATSVGCLVYAFGLNAFIIPHHLLAGGLTGVAVIGYYLTGVAPGILNIFLNLPILIAAYIWLGRWAVAAAVYGASIFSYFIDAFAFFGNYHFTANPLVGAIGGGIFCGLGLGIVYRYGGTSGGVDPIGMIFRKFYGIQIASFTFCLNVIVLTISAFLFNVEIALVTLLSLYILAKICNAVVLGFQQQKSVFIVSYKSDEISHKIMDELGRGVTLLHGEGAYTHEKKQVIMVAIGLMQVTKLKYVVQSVDPHAFLLVMDASDVSGGFVRKKSLPKPVVDALVADDEIERGMTDE